MNTIDIENKFDLSNIKYKDISVWMLIRSQIELAQFTKVSGYGMSFRKREMVTLIHGLFYGIVNVFYLKKFDYWFFTNNDKRYLIDGKRKDRFYDDIADQLGQKKSIFIEYSMNKYSIRKESYSKNVIGDLIFKLMARFFSLFVNLKKVTDLYIIENLVQEYDLPINIKRKIKNGIGEYYLFNLLIKICKPKKIFLICYYSKIPLVLAARVNNIEVIEYQHGVISKDCAFYNTPYKKLKNYFPNSLLTFGTNLINDLPPLFIFEKKELKPMGSFYLDYILHNFRNEKLLNLKNTFDKIVCVTSSGANLDVLMDLINELNVKHPNFLFILRPKHDEDIAMYLSSKIILLPEFDIYQILKYSDYNITIQSFVAYEADYYGVYNILLNTGGFARLYFDDDIYGEFVEPESYKSYFLPDISKIKYNKKDKYFSDYESNVKQLRYE